MTVLGFDMDDPLYEKTLMPSPGCIRIGCAGWGIPSMAVSKFDPEGTHLSRYSQVFNCCEINSSFKRVHKKTTWERWAKSVPDGFQFSVKAPKTITHEARLNCSSETLSDFLSQAMLLREKIGPILVQLPSSLEFAPSVAEKFLLMLRRSYSGDVAWEPRHCSWFERRADDLLKEYQIARVAADPACVRMAGNPGGAPGLAYFRLHGSPRRYYSAYGDEYLNTLTPKLLGLAVTARVWCIFDNTASGCVVQNALELSKKVASIWATSSQGQPEHL
jgi:uncharacterized protein YecE (DUF72 family)